MRTRAKGNLSLKRPRSARVSRKRDTFLYPYQSLMLKGYLVLSKEKLDRLMNTIYNEANIY